MLEGWVVSLFVDILVGMNGGGGSMLRDGDGLCFDVVNFSCEKVQS